jgi:hypothetical protein
MTYKVHLDVYNLMPALKGESEWPRHEFFYWTDDGLRKRFAAILREEVGRTVSNPAEVDGEIHSLCDALIAAGGRLAP